MERWGYGSGKKKKNPTQETKKKKHYTGTIPLKTEGPSLSGDQRTAKNNSWWDKRKKRRGKMKLEDAGEGKRRAENGGHKRG